MDRNQVFADDWPSVTTTRRANPYDFSSNIDLVAPIGRPKRQRMIGGLCGGGGGRRDLLHINRALSSYVSRVRYGFLRFSFQCAHNIASCKTFSAQHTLWCEVRISGAAVRPTAVVGHDCSIYLKTYFNRFWFLATTARHFCAYCADASLICSLCGVVYRPRLVRWV